MAGTDSRKRLLTLIRDLAAEKSKPSNRSIFSPKTESCSIYIRHQTLPGCQICRTESGGPEEANPRQSEMDIANAELEESKRSKDAAEQELKGYEVELAMNEEASIQTLERQRY